MYGLAAAMWTRDIGKAHAIANTVRAGAVWVNCYDVFDAAAPFCGFKQSGIGRELGEYGLQQYTEVKTVTVKLSRENLRNISPYRDKAGRDSVWRQSYLRSHVLRPCDLDAADAGFSYFVRPRKSSPNLPQAGMVHSRGSALDQIPALPCVTVAENRMYSILGRMQAYGGLNRAISRFARMNREQLGTRVWECLHGRSDFVFSSPLVQLFNPQAARGYALLKPSGTYRRDRTKDQRAEPPRR